MLSILIPTYNYDCTHLLEQLRMQSLANTHPIEFIVCDDGSTAIAKKKAVADYCAQYNLTYLENSPNLGRTATRNALAKKASYDWVLFLDADVLIKSSTFIEFYLESINKQYPIVSGGTSYDSTKPKGKELRWKYGVHREGKTAKQRRKSPYYIISQSVLIKKEVFLKLNTVQSRQYGLDNVFSCQIQLHNYKVLHINNPIIHKGLESNQVFLKKSIEAIETLIHFELKKIVPRGFTSLQKSYLKLKKSKTEALFTIGIQPFLTLIKKNLLSPKPSLFLFDLYRLYQYIKLKSNA